MDFLHKLLWTALFILGVCCQGTIEYEKILNHNTRLFEQHTEATLYVSYPGKLNGISDYELTQEEFIQNRDTNSTNKTNDGLCIFIPDTVTRNNDLNSFISLADLDPSSKTVRILKLGHFNFSVDNNVYILTDRKDIIRVEIFKEPHFNGKLSLEHIFTEKLKNNTHFEIISNSVSSRLYVISNSFMASRAVNKDDTFIAPFSKESSFKPRQKIWHALSFENFIVVSCDTDGLDIYEIGNDGKLSYYKQVNVYGSKVMKAQYSPEIQLLSYLDENGVHFIKIKNGVFEPASLDWSLPFKGASSFSQSNMQTFWFTEKNQTQVSEVLTDINNSLFKTNSAYLSQHQLIGTYLNDIYGIIVNKDEYSVYIHSIPNELSATSRVRMDRFSLEGTIDFFITEKVNAMDMTLTKIVSISEKSIRINSLIFSPPCFWCAPGRNSGTYEYKLKIQSQECQQKETTSLFYSCFTEDTIIVKANRSFITSQHSTILTVSFLSLASLFLAMIIFMWRRYKKNRIDLGKMEEKAQVLRKLKYKQVEQEKDSEMDTPICSPKE